MDSISSQYPLEAVLRRIALAQNNDNKRDPSTPQSLDPFTWWNAHWIVGEHHMVYVYAGGEDLRWKTDILVTALQNKDDATNLGVKTPIISSIVP
ncbi:hypothetical protein BS47DRAFT_1348645 [Hydnum rufescens UP504]|uniref:Uncharacterized protein n=1 Tax=Hydnum rufescens UP504 TaxID=1448309 RepID=A0A9P6AQ47_9AGAM|nr:hypothetical protein BS47DRAFT_1348645 [Hydnum rufescens UP504]